jgi:hypothetical protein
MWYMYGILSQIITPSKIKQTVQSLYFILFTTHLVPGPKNIEHHSWTTFLIISTWRAIGIYQSHIFFVTGKEDDFHA